MTLQFWWPEDDRWLSKHVALKQIINSTRVDIRESAILLSNTIGFTFDSWQPCIIIVHLACLPQSFGGRGQCAVANVIIFCAHHTLS